MVFGISENQYGQQCRVDRHVQPDCGHSIHNSGNVLGQVMECLRYHNCTCGLSKIGCAPNDLRTRDYPLQHTFPLYFGTWYSVHVIHAPDTPNSMNYTSTSLNPHRHQAQAHKHTKPILCHWHFNTIEIGIQKAGGWKWTMEIHTGYFILFSASTGPDVCTCSHWSGSSLTRCLQAAMVNCTHSRIHSVPQYRASERDSGLSMVKPVYCRLPSDVSVV